MKKRIIPLITLSFLTLSITPIVVSCSSTSTKANLPLEEWEKKIINYRIDLLKKSYSSLKNDAKTKKIEWIPLFDQILKDRYVDVGVNYLDKTDASDKKSRTWQLEINQNWWEGFSGFRTLPEDFIISAEPKYCIYWFKSSLNYETETEFSISYELGIQDKTNDYKAIIEDEGIYYIAK